MGTVNYAPQTMPDLFDCLAKLTPESKIIGGGTDLIIRLHCGACAPDALLFFGGIDELHQIRKVGDSVEIGAAATMTEVAESELLRGPLGAIADAARDVGSLQIRNNGTIGGNVANASPAGDTTPALFLLNADVVIAGPNGALRREPINKVVVGPGKNSLAYNEAIIKFIVPIPASKNRKSAFVKLGSRKAVTISRIGLGISLDRDFDGVIHTADVVAGAISLTPVHVEQAESYLRGKRIDDTAKEAVGRALSELILKITPEMFDRDYKVGAAYGVAEDVLDML